MPAFEKLELYLGVKLWTCEKSCGVLYTWKEGLSEWLRKKMIPSSKFHIRRLCTRHDVGGYTITYRVFSEIF